MAITKAKKGEIVEKLANALSEATAVAFVGFNKLTVKEVSELRAKLRAEGVRYYVAKKTLIRKALENHGFTGEIPALPGEVAVAWTTTDVTAPARGIHEFGKKLKGSLALLGGVFEGALVGSEKMVTIATIPPTPVLRGMFVNVINSPIQGLVIALDKIREKKG